MKTNISLSLEMATVEALSRRAAADGTTRSWLADKIITEALNNTRVDYSATTDIQSALAAADKNILWAISRLEERETEAREFAKDTGEQRLSVNMWDLKAISRAAGSYPSPALKALRSLERLNYIRSLLWPLEKGKGEVETWGRWPEHLRMPDGRLDVAKKARLEAAASDAGSR